MTQAELQELIARIRAAEFRKEAIPTGNDAISQARPIKGLMDEKGALIPDWFDCAGGFDKRYDWKTNGSPKRMIVRTDVNSLGKIGVADSVRTVAGQQSGYDDVAAHDDYGYPNAAEIRDADSGEEVLAFNNPTSSTIYPYWHSKGAGWVRKTKKEWFVNSHIEEVSPSSIVWTADSKLPLKNPIPADKGKTVDWGKNTIVKTSDATVTIRSKYNVKESSSDRGINIDTYFSTDNPEQALIDLIKQWLAENTFSGTYTICRYTPTSDWYGAIAPMMAISPSGYLRADTSRTIIGSIESFREAFLNFTAGLTNISASMVTKFKYIWVPWSGRFFITTDEADEFGLNLASWGCDRYGDSFQTPDGFGGVADVRVFSRCIPPMFFRKGVTYYLKSELRNAIICDYRESASMSTFLNSMPLPWNPIFPQMDISEYSIKERFLPLYTGAKRLYRMAYEVGKGPNITEGSWPNGKTYIEED